MIFMKQVIFLLFWGVFKSGLAQRGCPPLNVILPCRCLLKGEEFQIWCSHSDLPRVLEGLKAVSRHIKQPIDELILENNYLPSLPGRAFFPLKVVRMMLRYNGLERVSSDWLVGLENSLMELFIVEPDLRSLPDDSLLQLNSIEAITIQTNLMKRLPLLSNLYKLRYLQLESLSLMEISPRNFKNNPNLEKVHINLSPRLSRLEANTFLDLPKLKLINISYCGISWIHPRAITNLPVLKEISLMGNKIVDAGMVGRGSRELPSLEIIRLDYNYIDVIGEAAFVDLPELKKLYLTNNHITALHHGAFHRVPKLRSLYLNNNALRRVHPESFLQHSGSGLEELWLVQNDVSHIAELRSLLDALPRLTFLDMSYNNLESIPFGALRGHPTLEHLNLDYNKISMIDREAFMAMPALRELRLRNNSLSDRLEGPWWNLPALKGLDLSGNYLTKIGPELLFNLPSLRKLDLSSNELMIIGASSFLNNPLLEYVNISHNDLPTLHPATFRHLLNLYELDASYNKLMEFAPGLPRGLEYLHLDNNFITELPLQPSPDLDLPSLRMLDISNNKIEKILPGVFKTMPQLRRLYLDSNLLQQMDEDAFAGLERLESLHINDNRIFQIHPNALKRMNELRDFSIRNNRLDILIPELFRHSPRLKRIDVSRNQIAEILPGTFDKNKELQIFDGSHNVLVQLSTTFYGMSRLKILELTNNRLKVIDPNILSSLTSLKELKISRNFIQELKQGAFNSLQYLRTLYLDNNELEYIEPNAIRGLPLLKTIKLNQNKLKEIPSNAFNNLPGLQAAELQENEISKIAPNAFNMVPHLLMLNISNNRLNSIEEAGLRNLRSLEMLDVSRNRLTAISGSSLRKMEWLVELRMDENEICGIRESFNEMPRLRVLSMKNNKIVSFPEQSIQRLRGNLAVLDIDGNPLTCSCNLLWLQAWLQETDSVGPRCSDGNFLREMRLNRLDCNEEERNADLVAPGCEAELLSAPGTQGTAQVYEHWMKLKSSNSTETNLPIKNSLAPSPEESEYFYDEYIDYPLNETLTDFNTKQEIEATSQIPLATSSSPHYTPGDTPTIYAATKNKTKPLIPNKVSNSPSTSGFTFFGVPLPSLNFNNLLGNGRMADNNGKKVIPAERKAAIVNKPSRSTNHGPTPITINEEAEIIRQMTKLQPPSMPEIQTGGFVPILHGTGGFEPIREPPQVQKRNTTLAISNENADYLEPTVVSTENFKEESLPEVKEPVSVKTSTVEVQKATSQDVMMHVVSESSFKKMISEVEEEQISESTKGYVPQEIVSSTTEANLPLVTEKVEDEMKIDDFSSIPTERTISTETTTNIPTERYTEPEIIYSSTVQTSTVETEEREKTEGTSLTALLVPGGEQAQFKPHARGRITKVPSPHISGSAPLQSSLEVSDLPNPLPSNREGKTNLQLLNNEEKPNENEEINWYFANYNKTNSDPYIGVSSFTKSNCSTFRIFIALLLLPLFNIL